MNESPLSLGFAKERKGIRVRHLTTQFAADLFDKAGQQAPPPVSTNRESSLLPEELQNSCTLRLTCSANVLR